jgi:hypothetical protein
MSFRPGSSSKSGSSGQAHDAAKKHAAALKLDQADPLTKFWHAVEQIPERRPVQKLASYASVLEGVSC